MGARIMPKLLMLSYVASVIDDLIDEARAPRLQMHVNLVSVRSLSATYRHHVPISQPEQTPFLLRILSK